ncbi:MAG: twin-arginine translocase subunit TatC [Planctomycetales bacterium]|nr:twin-arginine translocase subunit TatC [Planctomycetales bacterium]
MASKKPKQLTDDLFEKSSMSFGDHLEELRKSLIKAFIWLGVGTIIGLSFAERIIHYLESPLEQAILEFNVELAIAQFKNANGGEEPPEALKHWIAQNKLVPKRVWIAPFATKSSESPIFETVDVDAWQDVNMEVLSVLKPQLQFEPIASNLYTFNPIEGFMIWLKAGLVAGVVIGSPGIFWHIWQFIAAGLYPHERKYVYWYLPLSLALFLAGICLAFFGVFRLVLGFLMTYTVDINVEFTPRLTDYVTFALFLPLGFGIAFQLPIVMLGLHRFGVVTVDMFASQWRIAVLTIAFLSMVLTPADPYTMMGLFLPLCALYFLGIFLCRVMPKGPGLGSAAFDPQG